jgi:hypothetical protein
MKTIYVAGAWVEQHQRARPMIARLREAGLVITHDWTQPEGDVCSCGHGRADHAIFDALRARLAMLPQCTKCPCERFNGIGAGGDSQLSADDRRRHAAADLDGVLRANIVWLLATSDKGASGSWVELGAALAARQIRKDLFQRFRFLHPDPKERADEQVPPAPPIIVVSGPKRNRTIFTELADQKFDSDEVAFQQVVSIAEAGSQ